MINNVFIRRATSKDLEAILSLLEKILELHYHGRPDIFNASGSKYNVEELEKIIQNEKTPIFVADDGTGGILGYTFCIEKEICGGALKKRKILYLDDICVNELNRGLGIGKMLLQHLKEYAKEICASGIELNVWNFNQKAISFYEHMGFTTQKSTMEILL